MNKAMILCPLAGAMMAVGVAYASDAHADEASYISTLDSYGVEIHDSTLGLGLGICSDVAFNGTAGIDNQVQMAIDNDVPSYTAAAIIVTAVEELCPSNEPALNAWLAQP